jgi:hypothetical protein
MVSHGKSGRCVIIEKPAVFNILPVFIWRWEIQTYLLATFLAKVAYTKCDVEWMDFTFVWMSSSGIANRINASLGKYRNVGFV